MKLYYSPGACSLSPHIVLCEAGIASQFERVDLATGKTETGANFSDINPNGYVPTLRLDNGEVLTEGPAIVQYLADLKPDAQLAPPLGSMERYRLMEALNFIATELHKAFGALFKRDVSADSKNAARALIGRRFDTTAQKLASQTYLLGSRFSVADAYLFTVLTWCGHVDIDLGKWPTLKAYVDRIAARPKVQEAMQAEGLLK